MVRYGIGLVVWCMIEVVSIGLERVTEGQKGIGNNISKIQDILKGSRWVMRVSGQVWYRLDSVVYD